MSSLQKTESKKQVKNRSKYLWKLQFKFAGKRQTIRLGQISQKHANEIRTHVDTLIECRELAQLVPPTTSAWLEKAEKKIVDKLASIGVCKPINNPTITDFAASVIQESTAKQSTKTNLRIAYRHLTNHWPNVRIASVTHQDAIDFVKWMRTLRLAENTVKRRIGRIRELFALAVERRIISVNPFKQRQIVVAVGAAKKEYIPSSWILKTIENIPQDQSEWRLLFGFARFIGCRVPSEIKELTWADVRWDENWIRIRSPKTEGQDKPARRVPIFAAISPLLHQQFERVQEGELYVFPTLRKATNPGTTAKKWVERAGIDAWGKFFNSLRASCETDLMDEFGIRRACMWIGNSPAVAMKNYSLIKLTDFWGEKSDAKSDVNIRVNTCFSVPQEPKNPGKTGVKGIEMTPTGLALCPQCLGKGLVSKKATQYAT